MFIMGSITNDMTRLRLEIDALRDARAALKQELVRGAGDLAAEVSAMRSGFDAAHTAMALKDRTDSVLFVSGIQKQVGKLREQVSIMRKENADDLNGARNAWCGKGNKY